VQEEPPYPRENNAEGQTPLPPLGDASRFLYSTTGTTKILLGKPPSSFHGNGVHVLMLMLIKAEVVTMHLYRSCISLWLGTVC